MGRKNAIEAVGTVLESNGGDRFRVELANGAVITAYPSGKVRLHRIRLLVGDRVSVELSPYDLTNGRITRRL